MDRLNNAFLASVRFFLVITLVATVLSGCEGDQGPPGPAGPSGTGITTLSATTLDITIDSVVINSAPVVELSATNEDGIPFVGISSGDLSFTIAKLTPGTLGDPSNWQNYINSEETATVGPGTGNTAVRASRESNGTLVNHKDGSYTYTFATDITDVTAPLAVSYGPTLTHRVAIQVGGGLPVSNPVYTFRPSDGAIAGLFTRDIVKIESCNECHNKLALHGGGRIDTNYCVTCHNPGSTDANSGNTVDFKIMIHKIHRGENLPSVVAGGEYSIYGFRDSKHDYSDVVMPQDIRNCTKCHDGSDAETPQGDNWNTQISMEACGSCHDNIKFDVAGPPVPGATDPDGHPGGVVSDNGVCITCHAVGRIAGSVAEAHSIPTKVASAKFQYNILEICSVAVDSNPICAPSSTPTVKFSVSDPTGTTTHGYGNNYDLVGATVGVDRDPEFGASASLNILTGWDTHDYTNADGAGSRPARANSLAAITNAVDNTDGTFTITLAAIPGTATGSGVVAIEGHPRGETVVGSGTFDISVPVRGEVAYFGITDSEPVARRVAVDIATKCDNCHDQLSLHGNNRADNAQLCVICHNPRNTDVSRRPKTAGGIPDITATADGKREESIDFKRMIHAIHAAQRDDPSTSGVVEGHGFRETGIKIYGFGNRLHDYSHVRFPGILNDCTTCHNSGTFELTGTWETPTQNGILSSTMLAEPTATDATTYTSELLDQSNDLTISPTAAVCSACHDSALAQAHMETAGGAQFNVAQSSITGTYESCSVCHGPGRYADVKLVHGLD